MTVFFSPGTGFFYDDQVNSVIPGDALEVSAEERDSLLAQQTLGRQVVAGPDGKPVLMEPSAVLLDIPALIAATRYQHETAGITVNGMQIDTSDRSKTLINGSALKALRNPDYVLRWKTPDGFVDLPAAQVLVISDAVSDYVQACFDRESALQDALTAGTYSESMLTEGWPE